MYRFIDMWIFICGNPESSSLKVLSKASSSDSGGGGSRREQSRARSSVVCARVEQGDKTHSFIQGFICLLGGRGEGFLIVRLHAGYG